MYDARQIANWFIQKFKDEEKPLTITKLLKLVYLAHGWYLGVTGNPLIKNRIEAWQYGPVIPDLYKVFRSQVLIQNETECPDIEIENGRHVKSVLNAVYKHYNKMSAKELSGLTHEAGSPWHIAISARGRFTPIPNESIFYYYQKKIEQYRKAQNAER